MARRRQDLVRSAERLVGRGKLTAAIAEYRKILDQHPEDTSVLNRVGDLYARLDRLDEAMDLFRRAAGHFARQGFFVKAIAIYKKIIRLDPTQIVAYERLADLYHRQGLTNDARAQYQVVADYYFKHGEVDAALGVHRKIVDLDPGDPAPRLRLAELYRHHGQLPGALQQYRAIGDQMVSHGRAAEASRVYLRAVEASPTDLDFLSGVLQELLEAGHWDEARQLLRLATELHPAAVELEERLGLAGPSATELFEEPAEPTPAAPPPAPPLLEPAAVPEVAADGVIDLEEVGDADEVEALAREALRSLADPGPTPRPEARREPETEFEIDLESLEIELGDEAEEQRTAAEEHIAELLAEADVLARYGLEEKAIDRLEEVLAAAPDRLDAYERLIPLTVELGEKSRVVALAERFAEVARRAGRPREWERLRDYLAGEGFDLEEEELAEPPAPAEEPTLPAAVDLDWLDEGAAAADADATSPDQLFAAEDQFFDLASELEEELRDAEAVGEPVLAPLQGEQSLEEIVDGFKRGMAETLSPEDFDTHFNLGIAYREMGLLDEAIGEFQLAAKDPRYLVDCCSHLAGCFVDKGFPELAIKWYQRGLESPSISEEESLGLIYELGELHLSMGDAEAARERFVEIYGVNSNFRDVVARLEDLDRS